VAPETMAASLEMVASKDSLVEEAVLISKPFVFDASSHHSKYSL
jgi:hypothetical protein